MAKELFHAGCDELFDLNDELDWKFVSAKFKVAAPKWQKRLHAIRGAGVPHASAATCPALPPAPTREGELTRAQRARQPPSIWPSCGP